MARKARSWETHKLLHESSIQLWVYEQLCTDKDGLKNILPKKYGKKTIKIVIPEYPMKGHTTDFRILYEDGTSHNVEVEWKVGRFSSHGKSIYEKYYSGGKGFIIALEDDEKENYICRSDISILSPNDFSFWFAKRSRMIADSTLSNRLKNYSARERKYWIVFLPKMGRKGGDSLSDYLERGRSRKRWAFRYTKNTNAMKNILNMMTGDYVVFFYDFCYWGGTKGRQIYADKDWGFNGLDVLRITDGYHVDLKDDTFEDPEWKEGDIENKQYMHYIGYEYPPKKNTDYPELGSKWNIELMPTISKEERGELDHWVSFCDKLRKSCNGGIPMEITSSEFAELMIACNWDP